MKAFIPVAVFAVALAGCADNSPGGKAVSARHKHFHELGDAAKGIDDELKKSGPNLGTIKGDAERVESLAPQIKTWFPAGSGPQEGKRTDAKAEVWTRSAEFQQADARLVDASHALTAVIVTGDLAAVRAANKTVGAACKGCHDKFKKD